MPTLRAGAGSRVERRKPAALVNLEVSGDVQGAGKDSVCISQLMLDHAAVTNAPRSTGSRTGLPTGSRTGSCTAGSRARARARAHAQARAQSWSSRTGTHAGHAHSWISRTGTRTGSRTELELALASGAGGEPGKVYTLSFSRDTG